MLPEGDAAMFDPLEPGDNSQRAELASNDGWEPLPAPPHAKPYFRHLSLGEPNSSSTRRIRLKMKSASRRRLWWWPNSG